MKKTIKLTESDLTALVRRILNEVAEEPIMDHTETIFGTMYFDEGKTRPSYTSSGERFDNEDYNDSVEGLAEFLSKESNTIKTIEKFYNNPNFKIPKFITVNVGTSHSGTGEKNAAVAQGRLNFIMGIVMKAFDKLGFDSSVAKSFVISNADTKYKPKKLNSVYDPKKVQVGKFDRYGFIAVTPINVKGLKTGAIQSVQKGLNSASSVFANIGWVFDGVEAQTIVNQIKRLQTYSDIQDLDNTINAGGKWGSLEEFLNEQLQSHPTEMRLVAQHLMKCAVDSQKQKDTVRFVGGKLSIGLGN
jgi:hypothetical protein